MTDKEYIKKNLQYIKRVTDYFKGAGRYKAIKSFAIYKEHFVFEAGYQSGSGYLYWACYFNKNGDCRYVAHQFQNLYSIKKELDRIL